MYSELNRLFYHWQNGKSHGRSILKGFVCCASDLILLSYFLGSTDELKQKRNMIHFRKSSVLGGECAGNKKQSQRHEEHLGLLDRSKQTASHSKDRGYGWIRELRSRSGMD